MKQGGRAKYITIRSTLFPLLTVTLSLNLFFPYPRLCSAHFSPHATRRTKRICTLKSVHRALNSLPLPLFALRLLTDMIL